MSLINQTDLEEKAQTLRWNRDKMQKEGAAMAKYIASRNLSISEAELAYLCGIYSLQNVRLGKLFNEPD